MKKIILLLSTIIIIVSCASTPIEIDETLNPAELFQQAQEASNSKKYDLALKYYAVFIENYPGDIQRLVEAEYEIAFITFKQGEIQKTKDLFTDLLERYEGEGASVLPGWPMTLSRKVLKQIEDESL
ncbi:MAG: hypothetical protein PF693_07025 [Spirochaetia bacterium]|jgi:outer membrane protein assembly factor BamD (BamD/ComL family)|nr:hypothetical protein [Spirochaetia bacterium]